MIEIRKDPFSDSVVIYSPDRENRPDFIGYKPSISLSPKNCPFCEGNEEMTPPEIFRIGNDKGGWDVRVIPNKFPVLGTSGEYKRISDGCFTSFSGIGAHEIIVETPSHHTVISQQSAEYFEKIFTVFLNRIADLKKDTRFKYISVFKNHKAEAGATISHHHSQLIATPFVPGRIERKSDILRKYYDVNKSSLHSDIISEEKIFKKRIVTESDGFIAVAPYFSETPYQISIYPKGGNPGFEESNPEELKEFSNIFGIIVKKISLALDDPPCNIVLHNPPFDESYRKYFKWQLDILPITGRKGGFESLTGNFINSVLPEKAAAVLRNMTIRD